MRGEKEGRREGKGENAGCVEIIRAGRRGGRKGKVEESVDKWGNLRIGSEEGREERGIEINVRFEEEE